MSRVMFEAKNLKKYYENREVLKDVSLQVKKGEVVAIIGPNGAGKSTIMEIILGIRLPDEGNVAFWCKDYRSKIGAQLQSIPFFPGLKTSENLRLFGAFYGVKLNKQEVLVLLKQCGLEDVAAIDASKLSGGQQKRLSIAMTLVHQPELLFLDEPTAALDPRARHEIRELIQTLNKTGCTIILTSHDMQEVISIGDRIIFISNGKVIENDSPLNLLARYNVDNLDELYIQLTN